MNDRVIIAGTNSGCGKTTVTCAVLAALKARGSKLAAFKCGPDYIDPMFHREALGVPSENLDTFFCTREQLCAQLAANGRALSVIEGVMGYYDGVGTEGDYSAYDVARQTNTPVILVVNAKGMHASAGALISGFLHFRADSRLCGVIFNGISPALYEKLQAVAREAGVIPLGFLPHDASLTIGRRSLGLIAAREISDIQAKLCALGELAERYIDLDCLLRLAARTSPLGVMRREIVPIAHARIAVARDEAFCFLYEENLALLKALGAKLVFFSPLRDTALPEHTQGLYLPGGYPELHAGALSKNALMRAAVRRAIENGMPAIAECGGFLYLHDTLGGFPMAGVIHKNAYCTEKLVRFGYVTLRAKADSLLCRAGESVRAHEFHYYESDAPGADFIAEKASNGTRYSCVHASPTLYAGFPHLYFPAQPAMAENFIRKAAAYRCLMQ